jgi:hypothetical protein
MLPTPAIDGASPVIAIVELKHFRINGCILCWLPANSKEKVLSLSVHRLYRLISALEMCRFSGPVKLPPLNGYYFKRSPFSRGSTFLGKGHGFEFVKGALTGGRAEAWSVIN